MKVVCPMCHNAGWMCPLCNATGKIDAPSEEEGGGDDESSPRGHNA